MTESSLSSSRLAVAAARDAVSLFPRVLKTAWVPLLVIHLAQTVVSQCFTFALDSLHESGREDLTALVGVASLEMIMSLIWSAAWVLVLSSEASYHQFGTSRREPILKRFRVFNQLLIEQVRALAAVLWRIPLLILPALVEFVRLIFVPYIVIFLPRYPRGEADALQESRRFTKRRFLLLGSVLLLSMIVPWVVEDIAQSSGSPWIWENPLGVGLGTLMTLAINCAFGLFLWAVFSNVSKTREPTGGADADLQLD